MTSGHVEQGGRRATALHRSKKRAHKAARLGSELASKKRKRPKDDGGEGRTESGKEEGIGVPEVAYEEAKGWYDGTTGEGAEQVTLSTREEGTAKDKAGIPIADLDNGIRQGGRPRRWHGGGCRASHPLGVGDEGTKVVRRKQALASDSMVEASRSGNQLREDQI
jgi:hypothetical protein